ncbi:uncharacterized protein [Drosophila kikkawai]|uniref:Uncharacterized protein n=1 Tax=Drosophila kikkawai TaxID=30033 RepID=A0ABM4GI55_DROKI|nr:uncharacterized protein LOC108081179 [Drosophila kikkawai]
MALGPKWEKAYERLAQAHYHDQQQVEILQRQLQRLREKRHCLQKNIEYESHNTEVWMQIMATMRREVERVRRQRDRLSPKNKKLLQQILRQFPKDRFEDRVRLMEVSEKLMAKPCTDASVAKAKMDLEASNRTVPSQQKPCDIKTQPKVDKLLARINADLRELQRIDKETMETMADIRILKSTIEHLKGGTSVKITPYVVRRSFLDLKKAYPRDIKATIGITRKNRKYITREELDIRPPYILDHVPQLTPDTFKFLQMNSKRKH